LLRGLARGRARRAEVAAVAPFATRYAALSAADRELFLQQTVRAAVATVLGTDAADIRLDRPLRDMGLDSLMAVELRNHLSRQSGLRLPSTLLFDYPTSVKLSDKLRTELALLVPTVQPPLIAELDRIDAVLASMPANDASRPELAARLAAFAKKWAPALEPRDADGAIEVALASADDEALYQLIDRSLAQ
jgi:acyl carrier protein